MQTKAVFYCMHKKFSSLYNINELRKTHSQFYSMNIV